MEGLIISNMEASAGAIAGLVGELDGARGRIDAQNEQISSLETRLAIHNGWNSRTSDNPEHYRAIKRHREEAQEYEGGEKAPPEKAPPDEQPAETRRQFRRRAGAGGATPKKGRGAAGAQGTGQETTGRRAPYA